MIIVSNWQLLRSPLPLHRPPSFRRPRRALRPEPPCWPGLTPEAPRRHWSVGAEGRLTRCWGGLGGGPPAAPTDLAVTGRRFCIDPRLSDPTQPADRRPATHTRRVKIGRFLRGRLQAWGCLCVRSGRLLGLGRRRRSVGCRWTGVGPCRAVSSPPPPSLGGPLEGGQATCAALALPGRPVWPAAEHGASSGRFTRPRRGQTRPAAKLPPVVTSGGASGRDAALGWPDRAADLARPAGVGCPHHYRSCHSRLERSLGTSDLIPLNCNTRIPT